MSKVKIGDVCSLKSGTSLNEDILNSSEGIPYVKVSDMNIKGNEKYIFRTNSYADYTISSKMIFPKGTIIFPKRGGAIGTNKKRITSTDVCADLNTMGVIPSDKIRTLYLYYYFQNIDFGLLYNGSSVPQINNTDISPLEIPLIPLEEQDKIAANLDKVTHTIDLCNAILEKLDLLVKSRFVEMFGEPLTNPMNWEVKRLDEVAYLNKGITYAPEDVSDEGIVVLRSSNIKGNVFDLDDIVKISKSVNPEKYVHKNDILMCNRNGSARLVGKVAKIPELSENMTFGTFMTIVRSDIYEYLFAFFQLDAFREQIKFQTAVAINQISLPLLAAVKVPIPPKKLIDQFAAFVEQTDKSKLAVKQVLEKAETLKKALMQEYFG